ncbi:MAG: glycosyltransferase family 2 protein [Planctomycetota bacterium]|jgi:glycosyltransferase involved in cell wall biosynthesis|nr:glycosyltransferase family 2 protein [Planctomycetota bacterium]
MLAVESPAPLLSLVVPCFNESAVLEQFYAAATRALAELTNIEIIFVDDGSTDGTLKILQTLAATDARAHYVSFSRNFGKEMAMLAGLREARGDYTVILDADLQHSPALIPAMLSAVRGGEYDCAAVVRTRAGDAPTRAFLSRVFYRAMNYLSDYEMVDGAGDFRLFSRRYKDALLAVGERHRFSKGLFPWVGFQTQWLYSENAARAAGETKWSSRKLALYALDGLIGFSTRLLSLISWGGIITCLLSLAVLGYLIVAKLAGAMPTDGTTTLGCIIAFFSGVQLFATGIVGQYIAKIHDEVKKRPHYLVKEKR